MGNVADKFSQTPELIERKNQIELDRLRKLQDLDHEKQKFMKELQLEDRKQVKEQESEKQKYAREVQREQQEHNQALERKKQVDEVEAERAKLNMEKRRTQLKEAELVLQFQADIKKIQSDIIKTRMVTQSGLFQRYMDFIDRTLATNAALITQQTTLYRLALENEKRADYLFEKADKIHTMGTAELIEIGLEKVTALDLRSSDEMKYLGEKLQEVLAMKSHNYAQSALADTNDGNDQLPLVDTNDGNDQLVLADTNDGNDQLPLVDTNDGND